MSSQVSFTATAIMNATPVEGDSLLTAKFRADEPGGTVLVMKGDNIIYHKCIGLIDMGTRDKIIPATLFNLGSISKTLVAN